MAIFNFAISNVHKNIQGLLDYIDSVSYTHLFLPLMKWFQNQCLSMGTIGIGIAMKIEDYLFSGEMEAKLYSGSVIRFGICLLYTS